MTDRREGGRGRSDDKIAGKGLHTEQKYNGFVVPWSICTSAREKVNCTASATLSSAGSDKQRAQGGNVSAMP